MELQYLPRSSITRTNARYRGASELDKYMNFIHEATHDIKIIGNILDRNEFVFNYAKGQTDFINENMSMYYNGNGAVITSNINTASQLTVQRDSLAGNVDLQGSDWTVYGGCTKSGTTPIPILTSDGSADPSGLAKTVTVTEGQVVYIRLQVAKTSGAAHHFTIGSANINNNLGSFSTFDLPSDGSSIYIGHFIYCQHKEAITINIDVARGGQAAGVITIKDLSITLVEQSNMKLQPLNTGLKARLNILEEKAKNILNNL
jgi:hypothetical protein